MLGIMISMNSYSLEHIQIDPSNSVGSDTAMYVGSAVRKKILLLKYE
jgi:hypothetical protein